jgi:hypothetical protein
VRAELYLENFTRGNLKVKLCQFDQSLEQFWWFCSAIFRGVMQGHDDDIWDKTYLNFCIKFIDKKLIFGVSASSHSKWHGSRTWVFGTMF